MKKLLSLMMVVSVVVLMTACGSSSDSGDSGSDSTSGNDAKTTITIAAAASLENAFKEELIPAFEKANPDITVSGTYDASGKLQTQIEEGADVDIFFSAATKQMDALTGKDLVKKDSVIDLLENKIVLIKAKGENLPNIKEYKDIVNAKTIAMGDPASVPAGQYAKESFEKLKIWEKIQSKKVSYGTNVTEVLNWVAEGSAEVGVVYNSDAMSMTDKVEVVAEAPADSVSKCIYPIGIVTKSGKQDAAQKFIDYLQSDEALKVFEKYGFKSNK